ncbi:MAG TPA: MOSC domain-containing protein [Bryobacteraceae bacterium]|nr:MOSC domain-containing protein [Bryobacteraceae bacterium]HXJ38608.1 MOSC domain-containing protein [Bryobacteraceae bacterium]
MAEARVVSVNVGQPRETGFHGGTVLTGIFKAPVAGPVRVHRLNLAGDRQADLAVHGGADKAVYCYPAEHYAYWAKELPEMELIWGMFGENLTTKGLSEESVHVGDRLRIGSAVFQVTQPRMPCYKLGIRFGRNDIIRTFWASGRSGFYVSVVAEGELSAGDRIERLVTITDRVSIAEALRLAQNRSSDDGSTPSSPST